MYGIVLSVPFSCIAGVIYSLVIGLITDHWKALRSPLLRLSSALLAMKVLELAGVIAVGTIALRRAIGPAFYPVHQGLFLLALPALVNVMRLQRRVGLFSKWYSIGACCAIWGLCVVLMQYVVFEDLFGVDGTTGPYAERTGR